MKIAVYGKGGSGKSTISAALAYGMARQGFDVLAFDLDVNQHLSRLLGHATDPGGFASTLPAIADFFDSSVPTELLIKNIPPRNGERLIVPGESHPFLDAFAKGEKNLKLLASGAYREGDVGVSCFHAKTGVAEYVLNRVWTGKGKAAVADMTAGTGPFGSGIYARFDHGILVIEPTEQSVDTALNILHLARLNGASLSVIANKTTCKDDITYIENGTNVPVDANVPFVPSIGKKPLVKEAYEDLRPGISSLIDGISNEGPDWHETYRKITRDYLSLVGRMRSKMTEEEAKIYVDSTFPDYAAKYR